MSRKREAQSILKHYVKMLMEDSNLRVDADTDAELDHFVDIIIEESAERVYRLNKRLSMVEDQVYGPYHVRGDIDE